MGSIIETGCGCVEQECQNECAAWGEWNDWGPWMPECLDNANGEEDTIFDDQEIHQPKRFRSRDCFVKDASGALTTERVSISKTLGVCLFADKFENEFMETPVQCAEAVVPLGEIETKVRDATLTVTKGAVKPFTPINSFALFKMFFRLSLISISLFTNTGHLI